MAVPEVKAAGFNSSVATVRDMVSAAAFAAFVAGLPPELAALIREPPLAVSWILAEQTAILHSLVFERLFARDHTKMFELGRLQLRADMTGIYRLALRFASPAFVAERTSKVYEMYARGCGRMRTVVDQPGRMEILIEDRPFASAWSYAYLRGTIWAVIELTGVKRVNVVILDGGGGESRCLFRVTWS